MGRFRVTARSEEVKPFRVTYLECSSAELPQVLGGYRMVQLTDLHAGTYTPMPHIQRAVEIARELKPELLLLTGDFIQHRGAGVRNILARRLSPVIVRWSNHRRAVRAVAEELGGLLATISPTDGKVGVFGNHDYYEGVGTIKRKFGDQVLWLRNSSLAIRHGEHQLLVAGFDDFKLGKPSIKRSLDFINDGSTAVFKIGITHNPDITTLPHADKLQELDLLLCGHTHGGQICLPSGRPLITRTGQREHVSGLSAAGSVAVYTTTGVGYGGLSFRLFCPPEITVVVLRRAD